MRLKMLYFIVHIARKGFNLRGLSFAAVIHQAQHRPRYHPKWIHFFSHSLTALPALPRLPALPDLAALACLASALACLSLVSCAFSASFGSGKNASGRFKFNLVVFVAGNHDHPILLNVEDRRHRPTNLAEGETALWNTSAHTLVLYHDRAELICPKFVVQAAEEVFFDTPVVRTSGEIKADGDITDSGGVVSMRGMREIYDSHDHAENDAGGPTDPPNQKMGA